MMFPNTSKAHYPPCFPLFLNNSVSTKSSPQNSKLQIKTREQLTGTSIQALNACSTSPHLVILNPELAQHPSTDAITPRHGFTSALFGFRRRICRSGGNRAVGVFGVVSGMF